MTISDSIRVIQHTAIDEDEKSPTYKEKVYVGYDMQVLNGKNEWVSITEIEEHHESRAVIVDGPPPKEET